MIPAAAVEAARAVGYDGTNPEKIAKLILDLTDVLYNSNTMNEPEIATMLRALADKVSPIEHSAVAALN